MILEVDAIDDARSVLFAEIAPDRYKFLWLLPTFSMSIVPTGAGALVANAMSRIRADGTG
jgi:hypothetical protein